MDRESLSFYSQKSIHKIKGIDLDKYARNENLINTVMNKAIFRSQKNLGEMAELTKQRLGNRIVEYQNYNKMFSPKTDDAFEFKDIPRKGSSRRKKSSRSGRRKKMSRLPSSSLSKLKKSESSNKKSSLRITGSTEDVLTAAINKQRKRGEKGGLTSLEQLELDFEELNKVGLPSNVYYEKAMQREKARLQHREHLLEIFNRSKVVLESLWDEMHISHDDMEVFKKLTFYPTNFSNYVLISKEIDKLLKIRKVQHVLIKCIERREVLLEKLKTNSISRSGGKSSEDCSSADLLESSPSLNNDNLLSVPQQQQQQRSSAAEQQQQQQQSNMPELNEIIINEVNSIFRSMRDVSVQILQEIMNWRHLMPRLEIFRYNGVNYVKKMQKDLNFLTNISLYRCIIPFPVKNNPLLLPKKYRIKRFQTKSRSSNNKAHYPRMQRIRTSELGIIPSSSNLLLVKKKSSPSLSTASGGNMGTTPYFVSHKYFQSLTQKEVLSIRKAEHVLYFEDEYLLQIKNLKRIKSAAVKIQTCFRGYLARKRVREIKKFRRKYREFTAQHQKKKERENIEKLRKEKEEIEQYLVYTKKKDIQYYHSAMDKEMKFKNKQLEYNPNGRFSINLYEN